MNQKTMSDTQKLDAIIKELQKLNTAMANGRTGGNSGGSSRSGSKSGSIDDEKKQLKKSLSEVVDELNDFISAQHKTSKSVNDFISAQDKINKQLEKDAKDASKVSDLQRKKVDSIFKLADQFDGSVDLMNKKAKQMADMLASSSKTFGTSFKAFDGGIADIQSTLNEFVNARANIAKLQEEETKKIKDSLDAQKESNKQLKECTKKLADYEKELEAISKAALWNADAESAKVIKKMDLVEAEAKTIKDKIKEEEKYRKTARSENKKREALIVELDTTVDNISKFSAEILDSKKAVNMWGKELDKSKQRLKDWAATTLTLTGGFALLKAGALELADKYRLVADVGMAGSMTQFSKTALSLNLTMSQLSKIVAENRAAFAKSGLSISQFDSIVKGNAKSLQEIGLSYEQSAATQAKMVGGAVAALGAEQKNNSAWITPELRYNGVHGVMRAKILSRMKQQNIECEQGCVEINDIERIQSLFFCNALHPMKAVIRFNGRAFEQQPYLDLFETLKLSQID
jgi:ABC-type transporter Mla subunit MlaD